MFNTRGHIFFIALLVLVWLLMLCIVNPLQNFPLNDDWMYARTVASVVDNNNYRVADIYSPVLVSQVYWGALFCLPFGFSFIALRVSVIVLGLIGVVTFYLLVHKLGGNKTLSFFCGLLLATNPLFFCLSNSFMTDVPFLAFTLIAFYLYFITLENSNLLAWLLAGVAAICATLTRQFGMVIPIAFTVTGILQKKNNVLKWIMYILPPLGIAWLLYFTLGRLEGKGYYPYNGNSIGTFLSSSALFTQVFQRCGMILYYSGFFLSPLLVLLKNPFAGLSSKQKIAVGIFIFTGIVLLVISWPVVPVGNVFNTAGLGPKLLKGGVDNLPMPVLVSILKCLGFIGAILLLAQLGCIIVQTITEYKAGDVSNSSKQKTFVFLCMAGYALLSFIPDFFFDRYILVFAPLLILLLVPNRGELLRVKMPGTLLAYSIVVVFMVYSTLAIHDYLEWNRVRWQALSDLTRDGKISPHKIDGGYEYNGWVIGKWYPVNSGKSWWFVDDDEYIVTFRNFDGYNIIKQYSYKNYLPFETRNILVLQRKQAAP